MDDKEKNTLEDILVAEVLILSALIKADKEKNSHISSAGGNHLAEAAKLISTSRQSVIALLQR